MAERFRFPMSQSIETITTRRLHAEAIAPSHFSDIHRLSATNGDDEGLSGYSNRISLLCSGLTTETMPWLSISTSISDRTPIPSL